MKNTIISTLLLLFPVFIFSQEDKEMVRIQAVRQAVAEKENKGVDAVTDFDGKTEFWSFAKLNDHVASFEVWSYTDNSLYSEYYVYENDSLIFSIEKKLFIPTNHTLQSMWNCAYYLSNDNVFYYISRGHGRTEEDDWNPDDIVVRFDKRTQQRKYIKDEYHGEG